MSNNKKSTNWITKWPEKFNKIILIEYIKFAKEYSKIDFEREYLNNPVFTEVKKNTSKLQAFQKDIFK